MQPARAKEKQKKSIDLIVLELLYVAWIRLSAIWMLCVLFTRPIGEQLVAANGLLAVIILWDKDLRQAYLERKN